MSTTTSILHMTGGIGDATYSNGSFLVYHAGVAYLNYNSENRQPWVFPDNAVGTLLLSSSESESGSSSSIEVEGLFKQKYRLKKADTIRMPVQEEKEGLLPLLLEAVYLEGAFQLSFNGDIYYLIDNKPIIFSLIGTAAAVSLKCSIIMSDDDTTTLNVVYRHGRWVSSYKFKKQSDDSSKKRKLMDSEAADEYAQGKKKVDVLSLNATKAHSMAKKSLDSLRELIQLEETMRSEAGADGDMFDDIFPIGKAASTLSRMVCYLEGGGEGGGGRDE